MPKLTDAQARILQAMRDTRKPLTHDEAVGKFYVGALAVETKDAVFLIRQGYVTSSGYGEIGTLHRGTDRGIAVLEEWEREQKAE